MNKMVSVPLYFEELLPCTTHPQAISNKLLVLV